MIYTLITVDPGVKYAAWAGWNKAQQLIATGLGPHEDLPEAPWYVIERPRFRRTGRQAEARTKDVEDLLMATKGLEIRCTDRPGCQGVRLATPEQWKGQRPKAADHANTLGLLTEAEISVIPAQKGQRKHVLDAVGIGLWYLDRRTLVSR